MHRAISPRTDRPLSSHRRPRRDPSPGDGGASTLLAPLEDPGPRDFLPHGGARVTINYPPPRPRRDWAGWFRRHWADLLAWTLILAAAVAFAAASHWHWSIS